MKQPEKNILVNEVNSDDFHSNVDHLGSIDRGSEKGWTIEEERAVRRKIDSRIVPVVTILYLMCFLDRSSIGNARIVGLEKDLKLTGHQFNWSLTMFYIVYLLVEIPSNIILKRVGARVWIPFLVAGFGAVSLATAFVHNFAGLMSARAALGFFEGGMAPGIAFYLSQFYKRDELQFRIGFFICSCSMAGAFGGLLAAVLSRIPPWGVHGAQIHTWRNIFFFEGLATLIVGILAPPFVPGTPGSSKFLTERENMIAVERLARENKTDAHGHVGTKHVKMAVFNVMNTICALGLFFSNISAQSIALFMPTLLNQMGYSKIAAQLLSAPPYVAAALFTIGLGFCSDKTRRRGIYLIGAALLAVAGYAIVRSNIDSLHVRYMAVFLLTTGVFFAGPGFLSWCLNNAAGPAVQAVSCAYIVSIGTMGAVVATWLYLPDDGPRFPVGHSVSLGAQAIVVVLAVLGMIFCKWENRKRETGKRDGRLHGLSEMEQVDLGFRHPEFRYMS